MSARFCANAMLLALTISPLSSVAVQADVITYGYSDVFAAGADTHIVATQNVQKYSEWQSPPVTYWGPTANNVLGTVTSKFDFVQPTESIFLRAELASFNLDPYSLGNGNGSSSLWASIDGSNWQLLLDNPVPLGPDSYVEYNQYLPGTLLGANSIWLQARMQVSGAPNTNYTTAQFSRSTSAAPDDVFSITVTTVPEPSALAFVGVTLIGAWFRRKKDLRHVVK